MSEWARDTMRQPFGCVMYDEIEGMLRSITTATIEWHLQQFQKCTASLPIARAP